jgi:hypothetical protein
MHGEGIGAISGNGLEDGIGGLGPDEGFRIVWMNAVIAAFSSCTLRWTPRLICLSASSANQRSTWLSQEALVG